jgi:hypothetical protein
MRRISLVVLSLLSACQFAENRYIKRRVSESEVVGVWRGTETYMQWLRESGAGVHPTPEDHIIELHPDHKCSMKTQSNLVDCRWSLATDGRHQTLNLESLRGTTRFYFDEERGKLLLWDYATDPDAWRYIEFERVR